MKLLRTLILLTLIPLLSACRMSGVEQAGTSPGRLQKLGTRITLLNWNAQKNQDARMPQDLKHALTHHQPDLIFLQEATGKLSKSSPLKGIFARSWKYPWLGGDTVGVLTASSVIPQECIPLPSRHRELGWTAPKTSLATCYPLEDGRQLLAVNVHCLNFERWGTGRLRAQLEDLTRVLRNHSGPILLAGDFNTWNHKRYRLVRSFLNELELNEVVLGEAVKTGDQGAPWINRMLGIDPGLALDRVFYRGLTLDHSEVLDYDSSDHTAVLARFII